MNTIKALVDFAELMGYGLLAGIAIFVLVAFVSALAILVSPVVGVLAMVGALVCIVVWHVKNAPSVSFC